MKQSRTLNSLYNFVTSIGGQFLNIVLQFVVRTVFISTLGKSYLGINGLFSNIFQMLSLAELGVGTAILFKLYDPLIKNDKKRIVLLLKFYKKVYKIIGLIIVLIGIIVLPFLRYIISDYNLLEKSGINVILVYFLYLLKTVVSYFFLAYKSAIVKADQKEYKLNLVSYVVTILNSVFQVLVLILFNSFELYIVVLILSVILQNYLNSLIVKKNYPYIDDSYDEKIDKNEIKEIFKDCFALMIYRINGVVLKATDNIIISMFIGLNMVGMYSNYYILYTTIDMLFGKVFESVLHSLGNLHVSNNKNHEYKIYKTVNFVAVVFGATAGIGIACLADEFVFIWLGKKWLIAQPFSILMGIEIFGLSYRQYLSKYRSAMGLFQQAKYRPLFGMLINLIVSLLLVNKYGICGVLIGTIVADWMTVMWYDPLIIHRYGLENKFSIKTYYLKNLLYIGITIMAGTLCFCFSNLFAMKLKLISFLIHGLVISFVVPFIFIVLFYKTDEVKKLKGIVKKIKK